MSNANQPLVLIADDDPEVLALLGTHIGRWGYRVMLARGKGELLTTLVRHRPILVLLDLQFGDANGLEVMGQLLSTSPDLPVALLTAYGSIDTAVSAMRSGAYDFLTKPPDLTRLRVLLTHAAEKQALAAKVRKLEALAVSSGLRLMGESPAIQQTFNLLKSVAPTDATVLILGESGTGKELAARTVHELSPRKDGPFIPLNTAALPRELAESLLFGHEKGAFTGADRVQAGVCELANHGTVFLDEIGEMELTLQAKLLRFLQERTVQRVGSPKPINVDVRVVAATNRDLAERVREGQFREDLYYRLNVVPIKMPPLRDRPEDIPLLAGRFLNVALSKYMREGLSFAPETLQAMTRYNWPGNVRQLENLVERLAILTPGPLILPEALADEFRTASLNRPAPVVSVINPPAPAKPLLESVEPQASGDEGLRKVDQLERQAILEALTKTGGKVQDAAHILGLSQATMYRKVKRYSINLADFTGES
jgi:two-component system, NtrC family, response regulator HydG